MLSKYILRVILVFKISFIFFNFTLHAEYIYPGISILQPDFYLAKTPDGTRSKLHTPIQFRFNYMWSELMGVNPSFFMSPNKVEEGDGSFSTSWSGLLLPIGVRVFSNSELDVRTAAGISYLQYDIIGSGGVGGMEGNKFNPKQTQTVSQYNLDFGLLVFWNKLLFSFDLLTYRIADSDKRSINLMIGFNYGVY